MKRVYLDYNATTPVHPAVREEMMRCISDTFGNPSSLHAFGMEARRTLDRSRQKVARLIGALPEEIIFTSSGTEANNHVVFGIAKTLGSKGRHIITTAIEHQAILNPCRRLEQEGFRVSFLPVDADGRLDPATVENAIAGDTVLITVMLANNDMGTIQPLKEIAAIARDRKILVHTDAVQAVGKISVNVRQLGVDMLSLSGHKIQGPKGIGVLFVRKGIPVSPLMHGGRQERGQRAGTENMPGIAGLGKACELAEIGMREKNERLRSLRDKLEQGILHRVPDSVVNGHPDWSLANTLNMSFNGVHGQLLVINLDLVGVAVSTGSACSSASNEPSHVLLAMGRTPEQALSSVRFSLGDGTTDDEIEYAVEAVAQAVVQVRGWDRQGMAG